MLPVALRAGDVTVRDGKLTRRMAERGLGPALRQDWAFRFVLPGHGRQDKLDMIAGRILKPMRDSTSARRFRETDHNSRLHVTAVAGVITGVVLLAAGAFLLSYPPIHKIAVAGGVSPALAGLYSLVFDAALVVACMAVVALRGAAWLIRGYAAIFLMIMIVTVAVVETVHAAGIVLPQRLTAATLAAMPWVVFLVGFGLLLSVLRHQHTVHALIRPGVPGIGAKLGQGADPWEAMANERFTGSGFLVADADAPAVRLIPPPPKPAVPSPEDDTPDVRLIHEDPD